MLFHTAHVTRSDGHCLGSRRNATADRASCRAAAPQGACPGNEESAGVNYSHRCLKGNRQMRRVLNQAANAAVKAKGTIFNVVYRRLVPRLGHAQAIGPSPIASA